MSNAIKAYVGTVNNGTFDGTIPHRLAGTTLHNGQPVPRRVEVRRRRTGAYVVSTVSNADGSFEFIHLPAQSLSDPYIVTCFDDSTQNYANAQVFDRVYQVNDAGNPPEV